MLARIEKKISFHGVSMVYGWTDAYEYRLIKHLAVCRRLRSCSYYCMRYSYKHVHYTWIYNDSYQRFPLEHVVLLLRYSSMDSIHAAAALCYILLKVVKIDAYESILFMSLCDNLSKGK